ncbi:hypothetical protein [Variovorax sp. Sphag1AA]|uniref:hypothetical protein n=1 Tax=Variovorax sp. Sphag1AA TaxID=2587027 RepID=UPI00161130B0|nr:hypothetical protein [Variovorax sp. Sphag1AA]MBB3175893.1 hypothetical protein [Variovorax sp. Sphag1AA]
MTARRQLDTSKPTPAMDFLRSVIADPKAKHADKMRAALALAATEKAAITRELEPGPRERKRRAASAKTGTDWDALLTPPKRAQ